MSFADLERGGRALGRDRTSGLGVSGASSSSTSAAAASSDFSALAKRTSIQIFKIRSNTTGLGKLVSLVGTAKDGPDLRRKLQNLTEVTRNLVRDSTEELKTLAAWQPSDLSPIQRLEQTKLSREFKDTVADFQRVQRQSGEKQRDHVHKVKEAKLVVEEAEQGGGETPLLSGLQEQRLEQLQGVNEDELAYNESLIQEREEEIRNIESGVSELNEIFKDLAVIVDRQGESLQNIESNINRIAIDTRGASEELTEAHRYQRKGTKRRLCLMLIFIVVLLIVFLAILI